MAAATESLETAEQRQRTSSDVNANVRCELEKLNAATDGINHLETEYEEAKALMEQMLNEALELLSKITKKIGSSTIEKAKPYFQLSDELLKADNELCESEVFLEDAKLEVLAAKDIVTEIEKDAFSCASGRLGPDVQEKINKANIKFNEATDRRSSCSARHKECFEKCEEVKHKMSVIAKNKQKTINKARPYFELKGTLYHGLQLQRERVEKIGEGICFAKEQYSEVLGNLENISEEIHKTRRSQKKKLSASKKSSVDHSRLRNSMTEASLNETEQQQMMDSLVLLTQRKLSLKKA